MIAPPASMQTYRVYFKGNVNGLIWYTPAQLEELGHPAHRRRGTSSPPPWTQAAAAESQPLAVGGKDGWPLTQWADPVILGVAGPEKFAALARGEIGWDDPDIVAAFETYAEIADATTSPRTRSTSASSTRRVAVLSGDYMFQNQGAFISLITPAECDESLVAGEDFTFFKMPQHGRVESAGPGC